MVKKVKEPEKTDTEILAERLDKWTERVARVLFKYSAIPGFDIYDYSGRPNVYEFVSSRGGNEFQNSNDLDITIPTDPNSQWFIALENIEFEFDFYYEERERKRLEQEAREVALAKLTNEERKLLGLK